MCSVEWEHPLRFALDIRRRGLLARAALWLPKRRSEVRTGSKRFDRLFLIRSPDAAAARRWLDREVRRTLVRLARMSGGSTFRLACDGEALVTRVGGAVTARPELRLFADSALWIARTIEAVAWESAVQFAPVGHPTTTVSGPMCPACAEPAAPVTSATCPVCRASHHPACWDWLGGCGVYGCAGAGASAGHSSTSAA